MSGIEIAAGITLADAALAAGLAATVVGTVGAITQGNQAAASSDFNAAQREREAEQLRQVSEFEEGQSRRRTARLISDTRAAAASQGLIVSEGTPLDLQASAAREGEIDALAIRFSGSVAEANRRAEAAAERFNARRQRTAALFRAGQTALTGASAAFDLLS